MRINAAVKLHVEDEVTIKKTKAIEQIIETHHMKNEAGKTIGVFVRLPDGNWYNHKEIS